MEKKYSKEKFDGYKFRCKVEIDYLVLKEGEPIEKYTNIDVYTDDTDKVSIESFLNTKKKDSVVKISIVNMASKEQDERAAEMIEETLKGW